MINIRREFKVEIICVDRSYLLIYEMEINIIPKNKSVVGESVVRENLYVER